MQSIERAFALLRALTVGPAGVTELAERVELPKSTVSRLLGALEAEGVIEQVEDGTDYQLGQTLTELASGVAPDHTLIAAARPYLLELNHQTGETSGLAVLEDLDLFYLDHVESSEQVAVRSWTGHRLAPHLAPSGIALLAGEPEAVVDRYLTTTIEPATERTVTNPDVIRSRIEEIREVGFLWAHEELQDGLSSVASPVWGADGTAMAALHIHGPSYRFPAPDEMTSIGELVSQTADQLSTQLAGPPPGRLHHDDD